MERTLKRKQYKEWSEKEEEALAAGVSKYGLSNWKKIRQDSQFAPILTRKSCDDLGNKWRNMTVRASEEKLMTMSPKVRKAVVAHIEANEANERAKRAERGVKGSPWTEEEEEALAAGVKKYGMSKWKQILEDPVFGRCLRLHSCRSLVNKWRNLTDRVSEEKLRRMPHNVRKVVDAYMRKSVIDDDSHDPDEALEDVI